MQKKLRSGPMSTDVFMRAIEIFSRIIRKDDRIEKTVIFSAKEIVYDYKPGRQPDRQVQ